MDTEAPLHVSFYTQTRLHTDTFTHRSCCKEKSLHRGACTQTSPHTGNFCLHTEVFTQRSWQIFTQRTFYTEKSLHTRICTQKLYRKRFCTQMLLHSESFTCRCYTEHCDLHRALTLKIHRAHFTRTWTKYIYIYIVFTRSKIWSSTLIGVRPLSQFFCDLDVQRSFLARRFHRAFYNRIFLSSGPLTIISCKRVRRAEQNSHFTTRLDIRRQDLHIELPRSNQNLHSGHALGFPTRSFAGGCPRPNQSRISRLGPTRTISAKGH